MLQLSGFTMPPGYERRDLEEKLLRRLRLAPGELLQWHILRESLDARKKDQIHYQLSLALKVRDEAALKKRCREHLQPYNRQAYRFPQSGSEALPSRPVVIGMGPAGLFCGLYLARHGYKPILLDRGEPVEERSRTVRAFWEGQALNPESNVQFGEGGAGAFSDGKLNTGNRDGSGRIVAVLEDFARAGAPDSVRWSAKPHVGTDVLAQVIRNLREEMLALGAEIRWRSRVEALELDSDGLSGLRLAGGELLKTRLAVLAPGHSARDTFQMLEKLGLFMEPKDFAVGLRMEHLQSAISLAQYGDSAHLLPPADYKLTAQVPADGGKTRGVYSFCMCPGGYVVNASSEPGRLAVNGMSYQGRNGTNANSAIVVTVAKDDYLSAFAGPEALRGVCFQRQLEERACQTGQGSIPSQRLEDFANNRAGAGWGSVLPAHKGATVQANLRGILPLACEQAILDAMPAFERRIHGFASPDAILSAVESRTSSPLKIPRDEGCESSIRGLYPCGEGAGYAGGITSAAADGIRVAEAIASRYRADH